MTTDERTINLLIKLKAMACDSSSPEEAAVAAAKMQELLFKHKLTMIDVDTAARNEGDPIQKMNVMGEKETIPVYWKVRLAAGIAQNNFCQCIYNSASRIKPTPTEEDGYKPGFMYPGAIWIIGRQSDIDAVHYIYKYLVKEVEKLSGYVAREHLGYDKHYFQTLGVSRRSWTFSFRRGAVETIRNGLWEQRTEQERLLGLQVDRGETALIRAEDALVNDWMKEAYPKIHKGTYAAVEYHAYREGKQRGNEVDLPGQECNGLGKKKEQLTDGNG